MKTTLEIKALRSKTKRFVPDCAHRCDARYRQYLPFLSRENPTISLIQRVKAAIPFGMSATSPNMETLLVCDDDALVIQTLELSLRGRFHLKTAQNSSEALDILKEEKVDIVLLDIEMRTPDEGLLAIPKLKAADPDLDIIINSGHTGFGVVKEAMRLGAGDYVSKDASPDELIHAIERTIERRALIRINEQRSFETSHQQSRNLMIGESRAITGLREKLARVRQSPANVVITGETGTGKEVVARLLRGQRADGTLAPFVAVDSATIQSSMAESLLFGHEKGAFTGATQLKKGFFEEADGGAIYFDEISNMPLDIQVKLLRVLQEKEVRRLGGARSIPLSFRVICATNQDLETMVERGTFKEDLLQRLNVIPLALPPLRERKEDIPALARHFGALHAGPGRRLDFTAAAMAAMTRYSWPGNIRELGNMVAYVVTMADGPVIDVADLPRKVAGTSAPLPVTNDGPTGLESFYDRIAAYERALLNEHLLKSNGNIRRMASDLRMDRSHLYSKLKTYKLHTFSEESAAAPPA